MTERSAHTDGTPCPEGTQSTPEAFEACCADFDARTWACYFDIRYEYWPSQDHWFIVIQPDAGGGGVAINHCPHCGAALGGAPKGGRWMDLG